MTEAAAAAEAGVSLASGDDATPTVDEAKRKYANDRFKKGMEELLMGMRRVNDNEEHHKEIIEQLTEKGSLAFKSLIERIDEHEYKDDETEEQFITYVMSQLFEIVVADVEWPAEKPKPE